MRYKYTTWGRGDVPRGGYAVARDGEDAVEAVIRSMERKSRLQRCGGPRGEGTAVHRGVPTARHYAVTLGTPCRGGGWTPRAEVWFAIPITAAGKE